MEDNTIDTLQIKIVSDADKAVQALNKLSNTFNSLNKAMGNMSKANLGGVTGAVKQLSAATSKLDIGKVTNYAKAIDTLKTSASGISSVGKQLNNAAAGLEKISSLDFSKISSIPDMSNLSSLGVGISGFADGAKNLAAVKTTEINRIIKDFEKLGKINVGNLSKIATDFSSFSTALNSVGNISKLAEIGTAFQGFSTALSGADKVSAGTTKLFTSLSQLAASANNIPIVTQALPALSEQINRFVSTMSQSPQVQAGTVSIVTALSGIAGAGVKAEKAAAALPGLTQGVSNFVTAMSKMPTLNNNVVSVVGSLSQLAAAGGKAGSAANKLQGDITKLSGSMSGLHGGTGKAIGGIKSFVRSAAAIAGVSYGFYALGNAIRSSISTASKLTEVQNVIDVTFGDAKGQLESFAATSIQSLGMSELMVKQLSGRFQAMGLALGQPQKSMANMSMELTTLAGDMASFYDVSQQVVGQDLEAIFTGQTKPLRKYGIDLTQATLKSWALSKGIDANFKSMTQLEKVQLRYAYVMEKSAYAQGDFERTSGTWANQTRILGQQFQQLGAIIGSAFIALLLPVVKVVNVIISKIIQLATVIGSFFGKLFGFSKETQASGAGLSSLADSTDSIAAGADSAADGLGGMGKAAKKAGEEAKGGLQAFDELNSISLNQSGGDAGGGGGAGVSVPDMAFPTSYDFSVNAEDNASPILDKIVKRFTELKDLFKAGFKVGLGDTSVFDSIRQNFDSIDKSLKEIFTDDGVLSSFNNLMDTLAYNAGAKVGAFTSIGATIIDNITGGAAKYLETAKERIKQYMIDMFNIAGETDTIQTNFTVAIADIFSVFRSDTAKQITADIIQVFSDGFMGVTELAAKFGRDVLDTVLTPITENADKIKESIANTLEPLETVLGTLADSFTTTFQGINQMYDEHIEPMFNAFRDGFSEIVGTLLDGYNQHIAPVLDTLADKFSVVWKDTIQPLLDNFIALFGNVADLIKTVWNNILQPVVNWIADKIMPLVAPVLEALGNGFLDTFNEIGKIFDGFLTAANGVVTFLTGVFSADWGKAWEGVKQTFKGIWDAMPDFVKGPIRTIIGIVNTMINAVETGINAVIKGLNNVSIDIPATPFTDAFKLGFDLNTVNLPRVPELFKGGILPKGKLGLLEGKGAEAVVPLEKNTQWISKVAKLFNYEMADNTPKYEINYNIPDMPVPQTNASRLGMSGAGNGEAIELLSEIRQQNELLREQSELLKGIYDKPVIDKNDVGTLYKAYAVDFRRQTGKQLGIQF